MQQFNEFFQSEEGKDNTLAILLKQVLDKVNAIEAENKAIRAEMQENIRRVEVRFPLSEPEIERLVKFSRMIESLKTKDFDGLEVIRANHEWLKAVRDRSYRAANGITLAVATTITGGVLFALWLGFKAVLAGATGKLAN